MTLAYAETPTCITAADDARRQAYADAALRRDRQLQTLDDMRVTRTIKITRDYDLARDIGAVRRRERAMRHLARTYERRRLRADAQWMAAKAAADAAWRAATGSSSD